MYLLLVFALLHPRTECPTAEALLSTKNLRWKEIAAAPESISLEGAEITLTTSLWRDYMPLYPSPFIVGSVRLEAKNGNIPVQLCPVMLWLEKDGEVWSSVLQITKRNSQFIRAEVDETVSFHTPATVDAYILVMANGRHFLLAARNQQIDSIS